jgi:hypothetical protein
MPWLLRLEAAGVDDDELMLSQDLPIAVMPIARETGESRPRWRRGSS